MARRVPVAVVATVIALALVLAACAGSPAEPLGGSQQPDGTGQPGQSAQPDQPAQFDQHERAEGSGQPEQPGQQSGQPEAGGQEPGQSEPPGPDMTVDYETVQVGDTFGNFIVTEIGAASEVLPVGPDNFRIEFSGSVTITAEFNHYEDLLSQHDVALTLRPLASASSGLLPTLGIWPHDDIVMVWNYDEVAALFQPPESVGTATVVIENLVLQYLDQSDLYPVWADIAAVLAVD